MKSRTSAPSGAAPPIGHNGFTKAFSTLARTVLDLANCGVQRLEFLQSVTPRLLEHAHSDALDLWIEDGDLHFRWEARAGEQGEGHLTVLPHKGRGHLEPIFARERAAHYSDQESLTTTAGSVMTGRATPRRERSAATVTGDEPYPSRMLIAFVIDERNGGILQLKSRKSDFFTADALDFFEGFAQTLGVAIADRRARHALSERIKELTCMYGISTISAQPDLTLEQILARVVELLPPAWQYPDIASARIVYDGATFASARFAESSCQLSADISMRGQVTGLVQVCYSEWRADIDDDPFLNEERTLLAAVAREIAFVAERKAAEAEKARLHEQLRHADRLATIGQLTAGVAHELNEPMSNILGFAQLAQDCPKVPRQARADLEKLIAATLYSREIIKKLMLFSRQTPTRPALCDLNKIITDGLYLFESRCEKEGITLVRRLAASMPEIHADASQLQQVLVNLVVNAIQAMPHGGVLTVETRAAAQCIMLSIEDTGIGMTPDIMKKIFLPFFTTKEVGQGTGLGLSVVHGIVNAHGGSVDVTSTPGHGSRFLVRLPLSPRGAVESA
jgi:signal transduction histidine kinase